MFETFSSYTPACCCSGSSTVDTVQKIAPPATVSGVFDLVDHFGRAVSAHSFGNRHLLVFFGFSHCAAVCPRELQKLGAALEMLGPLAHRVQPLYISVDPQRDSPDVLKRYLAQYTQHAGGFLGLTGSQAQVDAAKKAYRVFAQPVADAHAPDGYVVPHTALAYFMAPGGIYSAHFPESLDAATIAARMHHQLERAGDENA
jgi:protein SCO1